MPACLADVAAPILKLWVLKQLGFKFSSLRAFLRAVLNIDPVSALRLVRIKSGPGLLPLFFRYCSNACTGQT